MTNFFEPGRAPLVAMRDWVSSPERVYALWFGKYSVGLAWISLAIAVISPPQGFGVSVCWFHSGTGLPCPGCGLTRSLSCGVRGMFLESWHYHPLGLFILALFMFTAAQSLLPKIFRERVAEHMQARATVFNSLYLAFVIAFVGFGGARALFHLATDLLPGTL